jgi:hypothetical protein
MLQICNDGNTGTSKYIEYLVAHLFLDNDDAGLYLCEFLLDDFYPAFFLVDKTLYVCEIGALTADCPYALLEEENGGVVDIGLHAFVSDVLRHDDAIHILRARVVLPVDDLYLYE